MLKEQATKQRDVFVMALFRVIRSIFCRFYWVVFSLCVIFISGCSFAPVATPYEYKKVVSGEAARATVWGRYSGAAIITFVSIDGDRMPSRGGRGLPMSVSLLPGSYKALMLFMDGHDTRQGKSAYVNIDMIVESGATYFVDYVRSDDDSAVRLFLKKLDVGYECEFGDFSGGIFGSDKSTLTCKRAAHP